MAEGFARHRNLEWLDARSAGLHALGYIPAETIEVMQEAGISLDGHVSKGVEEIDWERVSILVEMAGLPGAIREFAGRRFVWDIPDPFQGSLEEYRRVRDLVGKKVDELLETLKREFSGGAGPAQPS